MTERIEKPAQYKVWVSDIIFERMGLVVEWGQPDVEGFYTPTLRRDSENQRLRDAIIEIGILTERALETGK